jgi:hypothetical protein
MSNRSVVVVLVVVILAAVLWVGGHAAWDTIVQMHHR